MGLSMSTMSFRKFSDHCLDQSTTQFCTLSDTTTLQFILSSLTTVVPPQSVRSNRIVTYSSSRAITAGAHSPTNQRLIVKATSCILMENLAQDIFLFVHVQSKPGLSWVSSRTAWFYVTVNVLTVCFLWILRFLCA